MTCKKDVFAPREVRRILGATDQETLLGKFACRIDEQSLEGLLPVFCVRSEIGKVRCVPFNRGNWPMNLRINTAVERLDSPRTQGMLQLFESFAASIAKHQVELTQTFGWQVGNGLART